MIRSYWYDHGEPPGEVRERAEHIADELLDGREPGEEAIREVAIADVETDVSAFNRDVGIARSLDLSMPAFTTGDETDQDIVPIALELVIGPFDPDGDSYAVRDLLERAYEFARTNVDDFTLVSPEAAREQVRLGLSDFLSIRIGASEESWGAFGGPEAVEMMAPQRRGSASTPVPGCHFTVNTNTYGLSVLWSANFAVRQRAAGQGNAFGGRTTTPVADTLQSGSYFFGFTGGSWAVQPHWELSTLVTLPGTPSVHLQV